MNKSLIAILVIVGLVIGIALGVALVKNDVVRTGSTVTDTSSLSNQGLYNILTALNSSLQMKAATVNFAVGTIGSSTVTSTSATVTGAAVGDLVLVTGTSTNTGNPLIVWGNVTAADTVRLFAESPNTTTSQNYGMLNYTVRVFPAATFIQPVFTN